jgi:hypothetical protein
MYASACAGCRETWRASLPGERYGLIFVAYNSFWLLSTLAKQRACLARVRSHLAKGGRFAVDLFPPTDDDRAGEDGMTQYLPMALRGQTVVRVKDYAWDETRKLAISNVRYYGEKHVTGPARQRSRRLISEFRYVLRLAPPAQVRALLTREGFTIVEEYGSYERGPLVDGAARAIFVCEVA